MSFRESITVDCDCCGREFVRSADGDIGTQVGTQLSFASHSAALRKLTLAGWYVDASVVLCPHCYRTVLIWMTR